MGLREQIKEIITIIEESNVNEIEVSSWWGRKIRVARQASGGVATGLPATSLPTPVAQIEAAAIEEPAEEPKPKGTAVVSPIVGTFYLSASPESEPFVKVGDHVKEGQTICIIEAMKIMNEIESTVTGTVLEILPSNAGPVEFNQPLIMVDPS